MAKKLKTTTITKVVEEPAIDNRVSVIKFAPKNPIEVIDISDDDEPVPQSIETASINSSKEAKRFANWTIVEEREPT